MDEESQLDGGVGLQLYRQLERKLLTPEQLEEHCFPRPHTHPGQAKLVQLPSGLQRVMPGHNYRTCARCTAVYRVNEQGRALSPQPCTYHLQSLTTTQNPTHPCCGQPAGAPPCAEALTHVTRDVDPDRLVGFVNTALNIGLNTWMVYALNCEFVYTEQGLEVGAVSVVDAACRPVYETTVATEAPLLDCNTPFSLLTREQLEASRTGLQQVQERLLSLLGPNTILVGHGLHHDLLRLRLIHDRVVDTSLLYPHPCGLPTKYPLRRLKEMYLKGHRTQYSTLKCTGNAIVAMMLARMKC